MGGDTFLLWAAMGETGMVGGSMRRAAAWGMGGGKKAVGVRKGVMVVSEEAAAGGTRSGTVVMRPMVVALLPR